jgi:DNA-binding transcriptional MerR regulator
MNQWYIKELSKLASVSVRTLHHYDSIDLLKPSLRMPNGFRLYSEKDLLQLQQILALKFLGFSLQQIKLLLQNKIDLIDQFSLQANLLQQKATALVKASDTLLNIVSECKENKVIPWETVIKSIEVYNMTQQIENKWVAEILDDDELKQYAKFEADLNKHAPDEKVAFQNAWFALTEEIEENLHKNPTSEFGIEIGKRCMDMVNKLYGKENLNLRTKIWEKGFKENSMGNEHGLSPERLAWLEKATDTYWKQRIYSLLNAADSVPNAETLQAWNQVADEMYGNEQDRKDQLVDAALTNENVNTVGKNWLKKTFQK